MTESVRDSIYNAIASIRLIDPHTHINPRSPASDTLADLLGYHYYTELAHSAGMPKDQIEEQGLDPRELVGRLVSNLSPVENTAQYRWLIEICRTFFGFDGDRIDESNWEDLYDSAERQMRKADWPQMVLDQSNVEAVFLTNDFDDELTGFDTDTYIPCLRTDDLVFHLGETDTRERLAYCTGIELDGSLTSLRKSLAQRFEHFVSSGARACAISLPPTFEPTRVSDGRATTALDHVLRQGSQADLSHRTALSRRVFWTLAELCDEYGLPFDLMIGVNRGVYADGVYQGQDLYDSRVSLIQYRELFNAFPAVKFPISVLASVTNQELVSYSWIFPNVITNGHWWYSNTPSFIARDATARLEAVPQTKQIAYYSDAYKLEFVWPKFDMYRRVLAGILADHFVKGCGWGEERAIELGRQVLRDNVDEIFPRPLKSDPRPESWFEHTAETAEEPVAGAEVSVAAAVGSVGIVDVDDNALDLGDAEQALSDDDAEADQEYVDFGTQQEYDSGETDQEDDEFSTSITLPESSPDPVADPLPQDSADDSPSYTDASSELELDPLPSVEEIQAVDVSDVELSDFSAENAAVDSDAIEADADPEPLDLGDMLGEDEPGETLHPEIRMLRGEESFELGEESLQLQPDPLTGELTFPVPPSDDDSGVLNEPMDDSLDEQLVLEEVADFEDAIDDDDSMVVNETIEIEESEPPVQFSDSDEQDEPVAFDLGDTEQDYSDDDVESNQEDGDLAAEDEDDQFPTSFASPDPVADPSPQAIIDDSPNSADASPELELDPEPVDLSEMLGEEDPAEAPHGDADPSSAEDSDTLEAEDDPEPVDLSEMLGEEDPAEAPHGDADPLSAEDSDTLEAEDDPEPFDLSEMLGEEDPAEAPHWDADASSDEDRDVLDESTDEPMDDSLDESTDEPMDESLDDSSDEPMEDSLDDSMDEPTDESLDEPMGDSLHAPSFLEDVEDAIDDDDLRNLDETIAAEESESPVESTESDELDDLDEFEVR